MTIFELVKIALDELYADGRTEYGARIDDEIVKRLAQLSTSYGNLWDRNRKAINYKDPATRFAYVYKYVAAHGDYIDRSSRGFTTNSAVQFSHKGRFEFRASAAVREATSSAF